MSASRLCQFLRPLQLLIAAVDAYEQAVAFGVGPWQLAVPLDEPPRSAAARRDIIYLRSRGWIDVRSETTRAGQALRRFRRAPDIMRSSRLAFIATPEGIAIAVSLCAIVWPQEITSPEAPTQIPKYDDVSGELWFIGKLVKRTSGAARTQRPILAAFQEEGWASRIDDPLPPKPGVNSKTRLNNLIKKLNSRQVNRLLEFHGDGSGEGIRWEPYDERHHRGRSSAPPWP